MPTSPAGADDTPPGADLHRDRSAPVRPMTAPDRTHGRWERSGTS
ncbi:Hypothetical protein SCLAV_p1313 (plasmid) [Streptomyces clavuligerus]|uniref:Uncharacterized protein n=1 Tax=Streptomyces clavuligerus TaxID=1901 RepID=B5H458_STRCL|nr:hypothetical protein SSCG_06382 [Streptomyces clavuligerus]EFG04799.1 Hypothetical protein SCLAV_p1313 [Streptomyces clavuligerus]